jgi:class 3 adenylate cyclase
MATSGSRSSRERNTLRASDADRERVVAALRDHFGAGRLSDDELDDRIASAYRAKTLADLDALMLDLPSPESALPAKATARRAPATRRRTPAGGALATSVRMHATVYVLVNVMLIAIWAASGGGYFWPIWPILGWGIGLGCHAAPLLAGVGTRRVPQEITRPRRIGELERSARSERLNLRAAGAPDGTVTILFSDIEGSTELNARLGDVRWLELLRMHHAIVRRAVREHGGFEVKAQGDGFMIALPSARRGAQCALAIQRAIHAELGNHPEGPIRVRIGMHSGEAMRDDEDFYGRNVSVAARIAEHARADEVLASAVVKQLVESAGDISFTDERVVELKGLGEQAVYTVVPAEAHRRAGR